MAAERAVAFAPGRVNLIGEHTDYNDGLALPFAIAEGVTVQAERSDEPVIAARAADLGEQESFALDERSGACGWRALVRGIVAELHVAGLLNGGACVQIGGDVPRGGGLSSSAALEVALCLALLALGDADREPLDRIEIARLCARVESQWAGAQTGLLDQLASLYGGPDQAMLIDFTSLRVEPVPLHLDGWRLVVLDSGARHAHSSSGYNQRRAECQRACGLIGVRSLREVSSDDVEALPEPLRSRALHVLGENQRVGEAVAALRSRDLSKLGPLLDASHASLRDLYEVSTEAVERAVGQLLDAGAAGARLVGGGFGGSVLGLFDPATAPPAQAREVRPSAGARLLD